MKHLKQLLGRLLLRWAGIDGVLARLDEVTRHLYTDELEQLHQRGVLPTGIRDWLVALRKADVAIPCKNPRPHLRAKEKS